MEKGKTAEELVTDHQGRLQVLADVMEAVRLEMDTRKERCLALSTDIKQILGFKPGRRRLYISAGDRWLDMSVMTLQIPNRLVTLTSLTSTSKLQMLKS